MKILFLANRVPYPPYRGDKLKIYNLGLQLRDQHELHLLALAENEKDHQYLPQVKEVFHCVKFIDQPKWRSLFNVVKGLLQKAPLQVLYFRNAELTRVLSNWLETEQYDAVHVQHIRMAPYMAPHAERHPAVLDLPDAFSLYWQRRKQYNKNPFTRWIENFEQKRLLAYEKTIISQYPLALVCSTEDQRYLQTTHQLHQVAILPNGVNLNAFGKQQHNYQITNRILFTGNMDYAPNVDAVQYFVKDIWPIIKKEKPDAHFTIAGQRPVKAVLQLAAPDITVTGFVNNLADMYAQASVMVAPLRFGAGTQNKVLEAMAMGVPVVCTQVGFEGLGVAQGEGVFKQTDAASFAQQVIQILNDKSLRQTSGLAGQRALHSRFGWPAVAQKLIGYLQSIASKTTPHERRQEV